METQDTSATRPTPPNPNQITMPVVANDGMPPDIAKDDVIRRNIPRELPCKLTDDEFVRISRQRVGKENERDELAEDLKREKKKREDQIEVIDDEIDKMRRELHTGYQDRTVKCVEVFKKGLDGVGYVYTFRTDTWKEVERRPATAHETQRHLKGVDEQPSGGVLDEARKRQRSAQSEASDVPPADAASDVPKETAEASTEAKDEGASDEKQSKPKKNGKKE